MKILVVEDDQFKLDAIQRVVRQQLRQHEIVFCKSVQTAVRAITHNDFDFLILDMSLPSHDLEAAAGLGIPRLSGGIEVLFELQYQNKNPRTLILTQYPEIEMENKMVPLAGVADYVSENFEIEISGCIFFDFEQEEWSRQLAESLAQA